LLIASRPPGARRKLDHVALAAEDSAFSRSPAVVSEPKNLEARLMRSYGAWLAGTVLGNVGMALHHSSVTRLAGRSICLAETHTVVLPHAMEFNRGASDAMCIAANALAC
jgi:alcohol dehydrogenase class IV